MLLEADKEAVLVGLGFFGGFMFVCLSLRIPS